MKLNFFYKVIIPLIITISIAIIPITTHNSLKKADANVKNQKEQIQKTTEVSITNSSNGEIIESSQIIEETPLVSEIVENIINLQNSSFENSSVNNDAVGVAKNEKTTTTKKSTTSSSITSSNNTSSRQSTTSSQLVSSTPIKTVPTPSPSAKKNLVGYYASWAAYSNFLPSSIDATKLTHINYAFANITLDNKVVMDNATNDLRNFTALRNLKSKNPSLKLLISIGGWTGSKYFSNVALTQESRETFANSCVNFIVTHGFDGIDLDWEYPVSGGAAGNIKRPEDKQNFTLLIQTIRQKLNEQSNKDTKKYFLTIAGAISNSYIKNIELTKILPYLDFIFIMGYDMHGTWDQYADFNAPLYNPQDNSPHYVITVNDAVRNYINAGAPASKLVLGMPFYGYKYSLTETNNNGLYQPFSSGGSIGYDRVVSDYLNNPLYNKFVHPNAKVPYLFGNNTFISYEDTDSIREKVNFAKNLGLGGVGAWELSHDRNGVLLGSAYSTLY